MTANENKENHQRGAYCLDLPPDSHNLYLNQCKTIRLVELKKPIVKRFSTQPDFYQGVMFPLVALSSLQCKDSLVVLWSPSLWPPTVAYLVASLPGETCEDWLRETWASHNYD